MASGMSIHSSAMGGESVRSGGGSLASGRRSSVQPQDTLVAKALNEISPIGAIALSNVIEFPDDECLVVRLSHDKSLWAVGLSGGRIQFYTTETCTLVYSLDPPDRRESEAVTGLVFVPPDPTSQKSERKHLVLASYATGQVRMWHYTGVTDPLLWTLQVPALTQEGEPIPAAQPAAATVSDAERRRIGVRKRGGGGGDTQGGVSQPQEQLLCLSCSHDAQRFVVGGVDGAIRVCDIRRRALVGLCQSSYSFSRIDGHRNRVCALLYHPLGRQYPGEYGHVFVSGGWDNTVQIWDDRRGHSLWVYYGPHVCGTDGIDIDPMQNHVVTCSWERNKALLQVWKFNDEAARGRVDLDEKGVQEEMLKVKPLGELPQDPISAPSMGYVAQWLGDQYMLFAGSNTNLMKVVDRGTLNTVASVTDFPKGVYSVASMLPDGMDSRKPSKLAVCSGNRLYGFRLDRK